LSFILGVFVQVVALQRELTDLRDDLAGADDKVNRLQAEREEAREQVRLPR
jgi:hypothetical protein